MPVEAFRIQNFMGFEDSGWIELRPITLLFGRNSTGKSAILRSLLLLQQSLDSPLEVGPFSFVKDDGFDYGDYREIVRDHVEDRMISFSFRCQLSEEEFTESRKALEKLHASSSTVKVRMTYGLARQKSAVVLREVELLDDTDDILLLATAPRHNDGSEAAWKFKSDFINFYREPDPGLWQSLQMFTQEGFLPWIRPLEGFLVSERESAPQLTETFQWFWHLARDFRALIADFLARLEYMGPLRAEPQRFYYISGRASTSVMRGRYTVRNLLNSEPDSLIRVNRWLEQSGLKVRAELNPLDSRRTLYELRLAELPDSSGTAFDANVREVGFGISQVLPVIAQTLLAPQHSTLLIEQPELHLHPSAQSELGDLFVRVVASQQVHTLIETHSEHLLLRLRGRIARTTLNHVKRAKRIPVVSNGNDDAFELGTEDLAVYFVERESGVSSIERIPIDERGQFVKRPVGFRRFFSDDFEQVMAINQDITEIKTLEHEHAVVDRDEYPCQRPW